MKVAYLFPGQGAQHVGMGKDLYEAIPAARAIFDQAEDITRLPLKRLCFEGPEDELARTDMAQPAIFTVSAATLAAIDQLLADHRSAALRPHYAAGLSLGEYTALYAAGAMDFQTSLELVTRRGQLMQAAATASPSGMVTVLGMDEAQAQQLCHAAGNGQVLTCANFNCPGQIVLSGQADACRRAEAMASEFGASAAVPLKVAGAFHSEIMAPAADAFAETLANVEFSQCEVKVVSNVDAGVYHAPSEIATKLIAQLTNPVRWQQSMEMLLADGVDTFYEIGPGRVLAGLSRRINRKTRVACLRSRQAVEDLVARAAKVSTPA